MLPPFIIDEIRRREEERRRHHHEQPQIELPLPAPSRHPATPARRDDDDRGVVIIDL